MAKRRAAQDDLLSAKRIPSQSPSADASRISFSSLALAGQAKYDSLQFDVGCTVTKGAHVIVGRCIHDIVAHRATGGTASCSACMSLRA